MPLLQLQEVESEIDNPTGVTTVRQPTMRLKGVLMSKDCGMLYELPEETGMKCVILHAIIQRINGFGMPDRIRYIARSPHVGRTSFERYGHELTCLVLRCGHIDFAIRDHAAALLSPDVRK